ncbi:MAG: T9SS type A sorting domain-containing protein [Bacteroidota bacterium]
MKKTNSMKLLFGLFMLMLIATVNAQNIVYVTDDGAGDGSSWANAAGSIQDQIFAADSGTSIWIKAGTYYVPGDSTFTMKTGVSLYGGFAGTETNPLQRTDYRMGGANETILSGDVDHDGVNNDTVMVVLADSVLAMTFSGLTVRDGHNMGTGGGMLVINGSPVIENCTFAYNLADNAGAGLAIKNGVITPATPIITGCFFTENYAVKNGAGLISISSAATISNCVFQNNTADNRGGACRLENSKDTLINSTFVRNTGMLGAALNMHVGKAFTAGAVVKNCVLWGNVQTSVPQSETAIAVTIHNRAKLCAMTFENLAYENSYIVEDGNGKLTLTEIGKVDLTSVDPLFTNTTNTVAGDSAYVATADWSLQAGSPLIDMGAAAGAPEMDINNEYRDATPDIGAYEFGAVAPYIIATDMTGSGTITPFGTYIAAGEDTLFTIAPGASYELTDASYSGTDIMSVLVDNGDGSFGYTATNVNADGILAITFSPILVDYTVTVTAGTGGAISPAGDNVVTVVDVVDFTITPDAGFIFEDLLYNGVSVKNAVTDNGDGTYTYSLTGVDQDGTLAVSFQEQFTVTSSAGTGGTISPSGDILVTVADVVDFTITPDAGFLFEDLLLNGTSVKDAVTDNGDGTYAYSLSGVSATSTLAVSFIELYTVTITSGANGSISPSGSVEMTANDETVFTIDPDDNYEINTCTLDGTDIKASLVDNTDGTWSYTLNGVGADAALDVTFSEIVGIEKLAGSGMNIQLYPNPSNGSFTIDVNEGNITKIEVIDIRGCVVEMIEGLESMTTINVNLSRQSQGLYLIKMRDTEGNVDVQHMLIK